jgi:error-prone DNA polymerase
MRIAMVAAGFAPDEADQLRRAMATFKRVGTIGNFKTRFIEGMVAKKYDRDFAERCFSQIEGFGEYGFPESHAASFALLVYASAWIKVHYPDVFCAALLNSQPMGFYAPAQIVRDAERHGVTILPPDVNHSDWFTRLEPIPDDSPRTLLHPQHASMAGDIRTGYAVRLGLNTIKGFKETDALSIMALRNRGYDSVRDLWLRTGLPRASIERLADGDAFRSIGLSRRDALWAARGEGSATAKDQLPLFDLSENVDIRKEPDFALPPMPLGEHIVHDYRFLHLSLKAHPLSFLRRELAARRIIPAEELRITPNGRTVTVAGLVITRQRPGTASGVIFMTLEDETDITNGIVWPRVFERFRPIVLGARLIAVTGKVQSESNVIHVVVDRIDDLTSMLAALSADAADLSALARADEVSRPGPEIDHRATDLRPRALAAGLMCRSLAETANEVMPKGRNFH